MASLVELSLVENIAVVALNRPDVRNAFNDDMRAEFIQILERVSTDETIRGVVLTGNGKSFCSGGDIAGMRQRLEAPAGQVAYNGWRRQEQVHKSVNLLHNMPKPVIAAVNGAASGLGCDIALSCDFILAAESAKFTMSFVNRGLVSDGGGMYFLPRRVGLARAKEMIFSGRVVGADEALTMGLADRLVPLEKLMTVAVAWAREMSEGSRPAIALSKAILNKSLESSPETVFALGREAQAICYTTAEHRAAVIAFLDKTKS